MYMVVRGTSALAPRYFLSLLLLSIWYQGLWKGVSPSPSDKAALLVIRSSIWADPLGLFSDWRGNVDHCSWRGVSCDDFGRVVSFNITGRSLNSNNPLTRSSSPRKVLQKATADPSLSSLDYAKVYQAGYTKNTLESASYAAGTFRGILSPAVGKLQWLRVLSLPFVGFAGKLPAEVSSLKYLEDIDLQGNAFSGSLPPEIGHLSRLRTLNMAHNRLEGIIPQGISSCKNLEVLNLGGNQLSGAIPTFFKHLPFVRVVVLSSNNLYGIIPPELTSNCGTLQHLHLADNHLVGKIPVGMGNCSHLQSLVLSTNALSGTIPPDIGRLQELQILDVSCNSLGGKISHQLANCSRLSVLVLTKEWPFCRKPGSLSGINISNHRKEEHNHFSSIPETVMALPNLQLLWAPGAVIQDGALSSSWSRSLEVLNLASNSLTGHIPKDLIECNRLLYLDLSNNKLEGILPSLSLHCMVVFNVSGNMLTGQLPHKSPLECQVSVLDFLSIHVSEPSLMDALSYTGGAFSYYFSRLYCGVILGRLPDWFSNQSNLVVIHDMSMNNFTGPLRSTMIGDLMLTRWPAYKFSVSGNRLNGALSSRLFSFCDKLRAFSLNLSSNNFLGELPAHAILNCTSMKALELAHKGLIGNFPKVTGALKQLVQIDLNSTGLIGELPSEVVDLQELRYYLLAENNLMRVAPETDGKLSSLLVLDFSDNNLTGSLPGIFARLGNFTKLLPSNTHLSGFVPENLTTFKHLGALVVAFDETSHHFRHSVYLESMCANVSGTNDKFSKTCALTTMAPSSDVNEDPQSSHVVSKKAPLNPIIIASITSGCAIAVVFFILLLLCYISRQDKRIQALQRQENRQLTMFRSLGFEVTYEDVVAAAGNFSLNNLIGTGGFGATYKAELSPGFLVAVKKLSLCKLQGTQHFEAEISTLQRIQHPNLVMLFGYHASDNEKFLIYNFLPGGNLENLLHRPRRHPISWQVRLRIALHVAQALAYLHDECRPKVIHRDIKPSNVLLDSNLNACLSDFGLAKLLSPSETHAITKVAGSFGYVCPEYAVTNWASEKADVYSYGVVLLELLSGKKAVDSYFSKYGNGCNLVSWASSYYRQGKRLEILDRELLEQRRQPELADAVKLAVRCTRNSRSPRPTMREVVNILGAMGAS